MGKLDFSILNNKLSVQCCNMLHQALPLIISHEDLHHDVNVKICSFAIFGLIFIKFSPKYKAIEIANVEMYYIVFGSFCLFFNWERADIGPQI